MSVWPFYNITCLRFPPLPHCRTLPTPLLRVCVHVCHIHAHTQLRVPQFCFCGCENLDLILIKWLRTYQDVMNYSFLRSPFQTTLELQHPMAVGFWDYPRRGDLSGCAGTPGCRIGWKEEVTLDPYCFQKTLKYQRDASGVTFGLGVGERQSSGSPIPVSVKTALFSVLYEPRWKISRLCSKVKKYLKTIVLDHLRSSFD